MFFSKLGLGILLRHPCLVQSSHNNVEGQEPSETIMGNCRPSWILEEFLLFLGQPDKSTPALPRIGAATSNWWQPAGARRQCCLKTILAKYDFESPQKVYKGLAMKL